MYISPTGYIRIAVTVCLLLAATVVATRALIRDLILRWKLRRHRKPIILGKCARCGLEFRTILGRCTKCGEPINIIPPVPKKLR